MSRAAAPPPLERTLEAVDLVAYAGATWDWHRMHYDVTFGKEHELPAPVVDGQMFGALIAAQVMGWAPPGSFLTELELRYTSMVFAGDTIRVDANIIGQDGSDVELAHEVVVGDRSVATGRTRVVLPPRST